MKKILTFTSLLIITSICVFYYWGSSVRLSEEEYTAILLFENNNSYQKKDTFSICTYNIGYLSGMTNNLAVEHNDDLFINNLQKAKNLFKAIDADFIGFQEIDFNSSRSLHVDQMAELANNCDYGYGARAVNWDKKYVPFPYWPPSSHFGSMLSGQGVLSKYPMSHNKFQVLKKPESNPFYYNAFYIERLAQVSSIVIEDETLIIINVHLEAWDVPTRTTQAETVLNIFNDYAKDYPVLLIGDFNSTPPFATNRYQDDNTTNYFFDNENIGVAIEKEQYLLNESANFTYSSGDPTIKIDFIFYNKNKIKPIDSRVVNEAGDISDHLPVWFKFALIK